MSISGTVRGYMSISGTVRAYMSIRVTVRSIDVIDDSEIH